MANSEISGDYSRVIKSRLQKKLEVFVNQELPILVRKGYLDVTEFRNVTENCNVSNPLVAQPAERGFVVEKRDENKSPRWDLNPRPKVSAPQMRRFTKPSPGKESDTGSVNLRSASSPLISSFHDWLSHREKLNGLKRQIIMP